MHDHLREIDRRLRDLDAALADVVRRLDRLEGAAAETLPPSGDAGPSASLPPTFPANRAFELVSLTGRTLIVLGGAFLLRALTDSGQLTSTLGISLGLAYAIGWLVFADRAAGPARATSRLFHVIAAMIIGLPLIWEASTRFAVVGAGMSAVLVGILTAVALGVAWRHQQQSLAGIATVGAVLAALALGMGLDHMVGSAWLMITLGVATWWIGERRNWAWLRWLPGMAAALLMIALTVRANVDPPREPLIAVVGTQLGFLLAYLGTVGTRTLGRALPARVFDVVMTAVTVGAGLGGALSVIATAGLTAALAIFGVASLLASAMIYGLAVAIVRRRQGAGANYVLYTSVGLALLIVGCAVLLDGTVLAFTVAGLALVSTVLGSRGTLPTLTLHGAILGLSAVVVSGLLGGARVWAGPVEAWPALTASMWIALGTVVVCLATPRPATWDRKAVLATMGRGLLASVLTLGTATVLLVLVGPLTSGSPPDAGILASLKTIVLAVLAVVTALASRHARLAELSWLVYPVLVVGAVQLLWAFGHSEPTTLFVALGAYGAALVVGPRLKAVSA